MNAKYKFCPYCSTELVISSIEGRDFKLCPEEGCGFVHWNNPVPVAATLVARRHKVALVKRKYNPRKGFWCPPCGFVNEGESPDDGSKRETWEEGGLRVTVPKTPFHIASPEGVNEHISFFLATSYSGTLVAGDDAEDACWFSVDDLPELAFSTHQEVISAWFKRPSVRMWHRLARLAAKVGIEL